MSPKLEKQPCDVKVFGRAWVEGARVGDWTASGTRSTKTRDGMSSIAMAVAKAVAERNVISLMFAFLYMNACGKEWSVEIADSNRTSGLVRRPRSRLGRRLNELKAVDKGRCQRTSIGLVCRRITMPSG